MLGAFLTISDYQDCEARDQINIDQIEQFTNKTEG